jgi:amidophosphoribosyltransferase
MCGVFGIHAPDRDVARLTYFALYALQHRGQESAGIAVSDGRHVTAIKEMGLVPQVFDEPKLQALAGSFAIGHTRYSTTGSTSWQNSQPVVRHRPGRTVALGHNGNLTNTAELRDELRANGVRLASTSDTEVICALVAEHPGSLRDAVVAAMERIRGAFSAVVLSEDSLVGFRDPDGIRPLVLGDLDGAPVLASETPALDIVGAQLVREIQPGELVLSDATGVHIEQAVAPRRGGEALCILEHIYFARPDALIRGEALHATRVRMGERLAVESPADADVVIPVPDSGTPAAIGFAQEAGVPFAEGLIKNRYVGRTFIQPEQGQRERGLRLKFNPLRHVLDGRRVVVVDDSIVRGTTTRKIVGMLREAGAREVHLRVSSPPIVSPCFYGIDMAAKDELIAAHRTVDEVCAALGADSLAYLSLEGLQAAIGRPASGFCRACLTGDYPVPVPESLSADKMAYERVRRRRREVVRP